MEQSLKHTLHEQAYQWVLEAGQLIKEKMDTPLEIMTKSSPKDLVTEMDKAVESFFLKKIEENYPSHKVLGEEGVGEAVYETTGTVWIIDPIDGTMNFVHQKTNFAISIGIIHEGIAEIGLIYNVIEGTIYHAKRGEGAFKNDKHLPKLPEKTLDQCLIELNHFWLCPNRRVNEEKLQQLVYKAIGTRAYGSAALELAFLAEGITDAYLTFSLQPWDYAGGYVLLEEVGAKLTDASGQPVDFLNRTTVVAANTSIHQELIDDYIELK
ncbi:inositol monophosphatase family protein [Terribacillus halophilus]|jgi:myo-inositol-1(or 4)-monophosphatase|uniref:inositol monophosphatase family protein n=1 Tax=Terribacillus halophilus TaxID=361279 RepID=UPI0009853839|nr:inositol monophosphatase family protein [Terribacillus halophilus]